MDAFEVLATFALGVGVASLGFGYWQSRVSQRMTIGVNEDFLHGKYAEWVPLSDCPIGLFLSEGDQLCVKTGHNLGAPEAFVVSTGEVFTGIHLKYHSPRMVLPLDVSGTLTVQERMF